MANIITGIRIVLSVALLFFPALSPTFYALYVAAGGLLFIFPLTLAIIDLIYSAAAVCAVATMAAVYERYLVRTGRTT